MGHCVRQILLRQIPNADFLHSKQLNHAKMLDSLTIIAPSDIACPPVRSRRTKTEAETGMRVAAT